MEGERGTCRRESRAGREGGEEGLSERHWRGSEELQCGRAFGLAGGGGGKYRKSHDPPQHTQR